MYETDKNKIADKKITRSDRAKQINLNKEPSN